MSEPTLRLDRSKTFSECHGDRTEDDPHYRVVHWQGGKLGGHIVLLPFDAHDDLVPDDGKTEPYKGKGIDKSGNLIEVTYQPLYSPLMRKYLAAKLARLAAQAAQRAVPADELGLIEDEDDGSFADDLGQKPGGGVDLVAWLKGQQNYRPQQIRAAVQAKYHRNVSPLSINQIMVELVLDEKLVDENELAPHFFKVLPKAEAA